MNPSSSSSSNNSQLVDELKSLREFTQVEQTLLKEEIVTLKQALNQATEKNNTSTNNTDTSVNKNNRNLYEKATREIVFRNI